VQPKAAAAISVALSDIGLRSPPGNGHRVFADRCVSRRRARAATPYRVECHVARLLENDRFIAVMAESLLNFFYANRLAIKRLPVDLHEDFLVLAVRHPWRQSL
jgi:hypothetical protein